MSEERRHVCLGFTNELYPEGTHICYLYNNEEERRQVLPLFIGRGLAEHESVDYLADVLTSQELAQVMADFDLSMTDTFPTGLLEIATSMETYCEDGHFVPEIMLDRLRQMYVRGRAAGYAGARVSGEMSWALRGVPGSDRLIEYESRLNKLVEEVPITVMCQYDARRFDGGTIFDILSVHPIMMVRGHILHNPFYVSPEQYLAPSTCAPGRR
jgi:hypothetical protein